MQRSFESRSHSRESFTNKYYPSLTSPLKSLILEKALNSITPDVFDRLQADTESRMRARLDSLTSSRSFRRGSITPNRSLSALKIRDVSFHRPLNAEVTKTEFTFTPTINQRSQMIIRNKYLEKAKISRSRGRLYDDDEYSCPADIEEVNRIESSRNSYDNRPRAKEIAGKTIENPMIQQQIYKEEAKEPSVTDRKYVPMFTKPFDITKILNKQNMSNKKASNDTKSITKLKSQPISKPQIKPLLRPISDSRIAMQDAVIYKQIVHDRAQKLFDIKKK